VHLDLIVQGGPITTMDPALQAEALGIWRGRVAAAGSREDVARLAGPQTRRLDLDGRVCLPGFIDAHVHVISLGLTLGYLDLAPGRVGSIPALLERLQSHTRRLAADEWVIGRGYDHHQLVERRHPTRSELDAAIPEHPAVLIHASGHLAVVNSRAADAIRRRAAGRSGDGGEVGASGLLEEHALRHLGPFVYERPVEGTVKAIGEASRYLASLGVTAVHDAGVGRTSPEELGAYQLAVERGLLKQRARLMIRYDVLSREPSPWGLGERTGFGDAWLRIGPVKMVLDGTLLGRTAALDEPYPGTRERGMLLIPEDEVRASVADFHRRGWQCAVHAVGDRAVRIAVEAIEAAQAAGPPGGRRHRIEHCGLVTPDLLPRMRAAGIIPVPQPHFVTALGDGYLRVLGEERSRYCYGLRCFLDAGLPVPGSSDAPVASAAPLLGIHSAVVRRTRTDRPFHPGEAVTPAEALRMYTRDAAFAAFDDAELGVLRPGARADFVLLSDDPVRVSPEAIPEITVLATYVAGRAIFEH
jgi:predicted amidohydrolase YtcJ